VQKRLPLVFRHIAYNLRGGFLLRPMAIATTLGALGASLSWLEQLFPLLDRWMPSLVFPSRADPMVAQAILSDIATSTMAVVSIVFAILLMTLTLASTQFSPRILISFSRDRDTQRTLGIFLGTFCYCIAALPAVRSVPHPFAPVLTVFGAMALALACVGWLLFFIHHISHAISVNFIVDRIAAETEDVIDELMPRARPAALALERSVAASVAASIQWDGSIASRVSGYIRVIDVDRLFALAKNYRVRLLVLRRVGHYIPASAPLLRISRSERLPAAAVGELLAAFDIGPSRTMQQDVEFGVLQIVDIALRAISPAVNDPSTAINGIDQLSRILIRFAQREEPTGVHYDLPGEPRLIVPWISFAGLLDSAFDQIRHYGAADVAVCLRLLRALNDVAGVTPSSEFRTLALERGRRIVAGFSPQNTNGHFEVLQERLRTLEKLNAVDVLHPTPAI
jgi:uncharacterized membrane protein